MNGLLLIQLVDHFVQMSFWQEPVKLIMKISGHKKETHFYKYIRITPEEAAQKIKELWEERGGMEMFRPELKAV
jgi:hypothetical protein